jgi:hypothetical protein
MSLCRVLKSSLVSGMSPSCGRAFQIVAPQEATPRKKQIAGPCRKATNHSLDQLHFTTS